jgi:hypothetical protein
MKNIYTLIFISGLFFSTAYSQLVPTVALIPMRDSKNLAADIYIPSGCTQCPVILVQTPYNRLLYHFGLPLGVKLNLNSSNYIFVIMDWRGFYGSAAAAYSGSPTRGQDGYDAVQWIAQQSWCNGKIATWGPSALGEVQFQTARENPPALVCIVPQVAAPMTLSYNAYFPGGDYRTEYVEQLDALGYGLSSLLLANPVHNALWTFLENKNNYADSILVPALMIGGWYDHTIQFMLPWFNDIRAQSPVNVRDKHRLLMGPWVHGGHGASYVGSATQGELSYPNAAGWSDSMAIAFLDYHMRNIANGWNNTPYVTYYQMGDDSWMNSPTWPPAGISNYNLYFHADTSMDLSFAGVGVSISYPYDPNNPSPTIGGPTLRTDLKQGPYNQDSAVESRNDILKFTTAVLTQDVIMKGSAKVHLTVSSNRKDTDFDVRLTDVYADGRSMIVNDGTFRMRFRNGYTAADTAVMVPNNTYTCDITLPSSCITFKTGHRIRLDITSSNYPRFNRNANNGGVMYPGNNGDSLKNPLSATNKIYVSGTPGNSYITLPLTASPPLAVSEITKDEMQVEVYPNPSAGKISVAIENEIKGSQLEIYNAIGEKIYSPTALFSYSLIDLSTYPKGIYFLKLKSDNGTEAVKKIVIIR